MYVHRSNRMEALADVLAGVVAHPIGEVAAPECIVVQSRGMERWLAQELARRHGIWANPDFPFPRRLVMRALTSVLGEPDVDIDPYQPETLMWSIAELLPVYVDRPAFAVINTYLSADDRPARRIQLAERIAVTFDQYVVYRPRMVLDWEGGGQHDWQAVLWQALVERHGSGHMAARTREFLARLRAGARPQPSFPSRVSVFGVSSLPPLYVDILAALARSVELHLFVLSPSREYWAEIRSRREIIRVLARDAASPDDLAAALALEQGNPLLASLGRLGRDFQQVLETSGDYMEGERDLYVDPGTNSMLTTVQSDILGLRHRAAHDVTTARLRLRAGDTSISVHSCHSPMREVEVLHDQLLALFDAEPGLAPHEVVVMTPAIDTYAPFVDAVFGGRSGPERIPYRISDRRVRRTEGVVDAFLRVLDVLGGRLTAPDVLDLLSLEPVRSRFDLVAEELDLVRRWVSESGIRWGADADHRAALGQPALAENTWRFGLDRLFLGYAMAGEGRSLFGGTLPYDDVEGTAADVLGRLAELCSVLFAFHASVQQSRTLAEWCDELGRLLAALVASNEQTAHQHQQIRQVLATLAARAERAGFTGPVDLEAVRGQIEPELQRGAPARGFLSGGVTFCALVPMRSIPFRVVCLLGMNDADFPRTVRPLGFDLMGARPQVGDRAARDDDRYLFLEALLAARQRLCITYVGQSVRDGSEIPPSVVVSELLDALEESFEACDPSGQAVAVRTQVCVAHPLQAFSPRYFDAAEEPRLFSYAHSRCTGARASQQPRRVPAAFVTGPMPRGGDAAMVGIEQLARFFENPSRSLLQQRLQLWLGVDLQPLADREPLQLDTLERWQIGDGLLRRMVRGEALGPVFEVVRATGALPPGMLGTCTFAELQPEVATLGECTRALCDGAPLPILEIDAQIAGTRLTGALHDLWPRGLVRSQFSQLGRRQELGLWVRHVVLNWKAGPGRPRASFLVGRRGRGAGAGVVRWRPLDDPEAVLRVLLDLYGRGQEAPLPFFPLASRAYVENLRDSSRHDGADAAFDAAAEPFARRDPVPGEGHDDYVLQLFGTSDLRALLDALEDGRARFDAAARAVYEPLLDYREELA